MRKSFAVRLSLRFMFILTTAVFLLSLGFLLFVRYLVKVNQTAQLKAAEKSVFENVINGNRFENRRHSARRADCADGS